MSTPFGGWAGPKNPKLLIVGEAWGENEWQTHQPFVGTSGIELWRMLGEALPDTAPEQHQASLREAYNLGNAWVRNRRTWLELAGIAYTNVLNLRPPSNKLESLCCAKTQITASGYSQPPLAKGLYLRPEYLPEVDRLLSELADSRPNCVLAAGNTACWALLRTTNIGSIRGAVSFSSTEPTVKVVPAYHPAAILRQWSWRPVTVADIIKARREAEFPELNRPERYITIDPDLHDIIAWRDQVLQHPPPIIAVDIETQWKMIRCIGFGTARSSAIVIPFIDPGKPGHNYWPTFEEEKTAWLVVKSVLESSIPKLFQNGLYDLQYLLKAGMRPRAVTHDTMLLHHSLYPEMRKGLGFLGSIYTNEQSWKLMGRPKADTVKRDE
jgi:uracil-DNA glycosylase